VTRYGSRGKCGQGRWAGSVVVMAVVLLGALAPASARAGQVDFFMYGEHAFDLGDYLIYTDVTGEVNDVEATVASYKDGSQATLDDPGSPMTIGPMAPQYTTDHCTLQTGQAVCTPSDLEYGIYEVDLLLGAGDDHGEMQTFKRALLDGGPGDDTLRGVGGERMIGGSGADDMGGGATPYDAVIYPDDGAGGVSVTLDGVADDGHPGEDDNVRRSIERVTTEDGDDSIVGNSGANQFDTGYGNDSLRGRGGDDVLYGRQNDDRINGGSGEDVTFAGGGRDRIQAADGTQDRVLCGGRKDHAIVDALDRVNNDCETVVIR
jgi:Ca2+-binding RTX toxin-like protein